MLKYVVHNLSVFIKVFGKDEDVIKVDGDFAFGNQVLEDIIYHPLEGDGGVCEPKKHDSGFKESAICVEHCLLLISFPDSDIVVSPTNV